VTATPSWAAPAIEQARVARLATTGADGIVRVVPICFAVIEQRLVSAVDHKPKRTEKLHRLDDIAASGVATVLIDHYDDDDWTQLWWVRIRGHAQVHRDDEPLVAAARAALIDKYQQYQARPPAGPVYSIVLDEVRAWRFQE
jgi:PPOX class probable F420-dependent enzyme